MALVVGALGVMASPGVAFPAEGLAINLVAIMALSVHPVTSPANSLSTVFRSAGDNLVRAAGPTYVASVERAVAVLQQALAADHRVLVFGNGGSASDALHIAADLVGRFERDRAPLPVIALTSNQAVLTAWSNDHEFDTVFARQLEALGRPGDVAWGISTSGNSSNVVRGLQRARELGLHTIGLTGADGGRAAEWCDVLMAAPATETPRIQEVHVVTYHAICAELEQRLFGHAP
jgi:D-sedoheptulose 7-phosphate isomerase